MVQEMEILQRKLHDELPASKWLRYLTISLGLTLILYACYQAYLFPVLNVSLVFVIVVIVFFQILDCRAWFIILPGLLVTLDLSPWSGRFVFNELDFIVIAILGAAFLTQKLEFKQFFNKGFFLPLAIVILVLVSSDMDGIWREIGYPSTSNPYYSHLYHFKVAKGIFYGVSMAVFFSGVYQNNKTQSINFLIYGGWIASFSLFLVILWERHTYLPLLQLQPWWAIASSFLDLNSSYRVTGLFSDMHTGGEAIDGIFLLLLPLNLLGYFWFKTHAKRVFSLLVLLILIYCIIVGYTRATYVSAAISVIGFAVLYRIKFNSLKSISILNMVCCSGLLIGNYFLFIFAGYVGVLSFILLITAGVISHIVKIKFNDSRYTPSFIMAIVSVFTVFICLNQQYESKWITPSLIGAISIILSISSITFVSHFIITKVNSQKVEEIVLKGFILIILSIVLTMTIGGYQINSRLQTINADIEHRLNHWQDVLASSNDGWAIKLLGNGIGSFPLNYVLSYPDKVSDIGSFTISDSKQLMLGPGADLAFGQRIHIEPETDYKILITTPTPTPTLSTVSLFLCERNLIFASNFSANCVSKSIKIKGLKTEFIINSKGVGKYQNALLHWPALLYIKNIYSQSEVQISNISIKELNDEKNLLNNSNFQNGLDHWFFYNDFEHLPWHIKNLYLSVYYQLGLFGCVLFLVVFIRIVIANTYSDETKLLQVFICAYLFGICSFGVFGDPLDSARSSLLFYTFLFGFLLISKSENFLKKNNNNC